VILDLEIGPTGDGPSQAFKAAIRELYGNPTAPAHQVVAVMLRDAGVVAMPMLHVNMLDQAEAGQEVHGAVDARQADPGVNFPGATVELGDLEVFRRAG
jgi:hypothetical protein